MGSWRLRRARSFVRALAAAAVAAALVAQVAGSASAVPRVSDQYFGMHVPGSDTAWPDAKVGAVNLTTNLVYWPQLEPTEGTFDWTRLDALVAQARAYGARPLLVLGQTPSYASTSPTTANVAGTVPTMAAWKTFVSAVAERYKTRIDYEIWPEPNAASNWLGTPGAARRARGRGGPDHPWCGPQGRRGLSRDGGAVPVPDA